MKNILRVLAYVFLSVQCANMFTLTTKDCDLSDEDVARLTRARDHKYAFVTPKLCNQLCLIYEKDAISRTAKWHLCSVVEEIKKGKYAKVKTNIVLTDKKIPVNYKLLLRKNQWRIYDFSAEGVSLISTYTNDYKSTLKRGGLAGLNEILRKKTTVKAS